MAESQRVAPRMHDISTIISSATPPWPGDTPFSCGWPMLIANGAAVNVSSITMSPHVGTHADAPLHVRDGQPAAEELALEAFLGPAVVVDVTAAASVLSIEDMVRVLDAEPAALLAEAPRLLLKSGRTVTDGQFPDSWPVLSESCAMSLLEYGLRLLGTDAPSVDARESRTLAVHHALFAGAATILENLDLSSVRPGRYELIALPLRLAGTDAAPVRALLREV